MLSLIEANGEKSLQRTNEYEKNLSPMLNWLLGSFLVLGRLLREVVSLPVWESTEIDGLSFQAPRLLMRLKPLCRQFVMPKSCPYSRVVQEAAHNFLLAANFAYRESAL